MKILPALLLILCVSCSDNKNRQLIIGHWTGTEWLIDGKPSGRDVAATSFSFDDKENYVFDYAGQKESGTYKVENDMLFTKPEGQREIMVKIGKLTKDSLVFDMNRSGESERLTLLRR